MFVFRKNKRLLEMLQEYLSLVCETLDEFSDAFSHMLTDGLDDHFRELGRKTHQKESNADDLRREIEFEM